MSTLKLSILIGLSLGALSCAEKRQPPTPKTQTTPAPATQPSASGGAATTQAGEERLPESFLASEAAKSFVRPDGSPASEGSLSLLRALDLNEDGAPEVVLVPGPRFCGTGGCALPKIFEEREGAWRELSALQSDTPQSNEVSAIERLPEVFGRYHSLKFKRPHSNEWLLRFDGKMYQLVTDSLASDRLSEERSAALMLAGSYYDQSRGLAPIGLWDKQGVNQGAVITAEITAPDQQRFTLELGVIASPDAWHQAFFPVDFAGAPAVLSPGVYRVEYRVGGLLAATQEFTVK